MLRLRRAAEGDVGPPVLRLRAIAEPVVPGLARGRADLGGCSEYDVIPYPFDGACVGGATTARR